MRTHGCIVDHDLWVVRAARKYGVAGFIEISSVRLQRCQSARAPSSIARDRDNELQVLPR
jgi:hypothetical protein